MIKFFITALLLLLSNCRVPDNAGFYQPILMQTATPEGPPEYKAGWHAGCRMGLSTKVFNNSWVYQREDSMDGGSGVYQHDKAFQRGYGQGLFACYTRVLDLKNHPNLSGPLE